jgi:hypothetical protein
MSDTPTADRIIEHLRTLDDNPMAERFIARIQLADDPEAEALKIQRQIEATVEVLARALRPVLDWVQRVGQVVVDATERWKSTGIDEAEQHANRRT